MGVKKASEKYWSHHENNFNDIDLCWASTSSETLLFHVQDSILNKKLLITSILWIIAPLFGRKKRWRIKMRRVQTSLNLFSYFNFLFHFSFIFSVNISKSEHDVEIEKDIFSSLESSTFRLTSGFAFFSRVFFRRLLLHFVTNFDFDLENVCTDWHWHISLFASTHSTPSVDFHFNFNVPKIVY